MAEENQTQEIPSKNHIIISDKTDIRAKWYVVHTYSGHENKVAQALKQRVESMDLTDYIHEVLIPTQNKIKIQKGKKLEIAEKVFPGYILVKMVLNDQAWLTVRTTNGVTTFIGMDNKPTPISKKEVEAIKKFMVQEAPKYKTIFTPGDAVKIIDGPFNDFLGNVQSVDEDKGKVKVLVSIFGRETPVELDFLQVQKI
ncbi:transcription termination/antitermination factor NusG [Candidatus Beckwithbacteria bacterium]|nr:transcription termination/antitermination factor NusG [Candidatus Beckwithbacteria bacterium]